MRRFVVLLVFVLVSIVGLGVAPGGAADTTPTLTRVRLVLTTTSEWASLRFAGAYIKAFKFTSTTSGASVQRGRDIIVVSGPSPASTTVNLVLSVPVGAQTSFVLAKSKYGYARAEVLRTNTSPLEILDLTNTRTDGDCTITVPVSRSTLVGDGLLIPMLDPRRLVLAFYYPWFEEGDFNSGGWYDKPSGPWRTNVVSEINAMVNQAASNGINGFIFSWDGRYDRPQRFDYLLDAAEARSGFYASATLNLLYWRNSNGTFDVPAIKAAAVALLSRSWRPAFLRVADGRPVVFVYGAYQMGAANWRSLASSLRSAGHSFFAVGDSTDQSFAFEGSYFYNPNELTESQLNYRYTGAAHLLRLQAQVDPAVPQRLWAATVSPGQNMSYISPLFPRSEPRDGGARYDETWRPAVKSQPEWMLITSWNEWYEATHVSPSTRFGSTALSQTKNWSASFKGGVVPTGTASTSSSGGTNGGILDSVLSPTAWW